MKKRWTAMLCCLLMIFQLGTLPVLSSRTVYFTAINANVLPLTDSMPFWSGGYLYVDSSIFTTAKNTPGSLLGIYRSLNTVKKLMVLSLDGRSLIFDLTTNTVQDNQGISYYPAGIQRGGKVFVPISLVTYFFDLTYSSTRVSQEGGYHGYLVRIKNDKTPLPSDRAFADAASYLMGKRYAEYLKSTEPPAPPPPNPPPLPPQDQTKEPPAPEVKTIRLCLQASDADETGKWLNTLDRYGTRAMFYAAPEFLEAQGGLLRRMFVTGYGVGLLVDGSRAGESVLEQAERGNQALEQATWSRTRLVRGVDLTPEDRAVLQEAGYCLMPEHLDWSGRSLRGAETAEALLKSVESRKGAVTVWLGSSPKDGGLQALLSAAHTTGHQFQLLTELS